MKDALLIDDPNTWRAVKLLRTKFMMNIDFVPVAENQKDLALFLTAEGVLIPGEDSGTFKISSLLVRWMVLQQIIPQVFPSSLKVETLDILEILKQAIRSFDKENIVVPNLISFQITGQWYLIRRTNERNYYKCTDIAIQTSYGCSRAIGNNDT
ncbi:hypothetical protein Glove_221g90 [Diversispora epigaea]|uniref:Uncharacterized protein n=1 Tax=Diversispora epigaea TaxID=1348612 RepID=A0A397IF73_9GLOM|nr:hypothetical protein Glove_221g90 [Diversispora epigaea]